MMTSTNVLVCILRSPTFHLIVPRLSSLPRFAGSRRGVALISMDSSVMVTRWVKILKFNTTTPLDGQLVPFGGYLGPRELVIVEVLVEMVMFQSS